MTLEGNLELHVTKEVTWLKAILVETRIFLIKILNKYVDHSKLRMLQVVTWARQALKERVAARTAAVAAIPIATSRLNSQPRQDRCELSRQ